MGYDEYLRAIFALVFVLGLMVSFLWVLRRFNLVATTGGTGRLAGRGPAKLRRLGVVETLPIDARRRLILIRRDNLEHLVMVSLNGETVIESGISVQSEPAPEPVL